VALVDKSKRQMRAFEIMRDFTMVNAAEAPSHKALKWDHLVGFAAMSAPAPILKHPGIGTVAQTFLSNVQRVKWMQTVISSCHFKLSFQAVISSCHFKHDKTGLLWYYRS